jgi:hypothetical protein
MRATLVRPVSGDGEPVAGRAGHTGQVPLTPEQRRQRARAGAYAQQAAHDTRLTTAGARQAFNQRFIRQVDPDGVLPEPERLRRAAAARKAYFAALALRSAIKRGKKIEDLSVTADC